MATQSTYVGIQRWLDFTLPYSIWWDIARWIVLVVAFILGVFAFRVGAIKRPGSPEVTTPSRDVAWAMMLTCLAIIFREVEQLGRPLIVWQISMWTVILIFLARAVHRRI